MFKVEKFCKTSSARIGSLQTDHGIIKTPAFMPIGTYAAIKTLSTDEIKQLNFNLILSNTYHLYLRPGLDILTKFKGLHNFMNWDGAILTDSGGYQIYSLSKFRKIDDNGVEFRSHLDGSKHYFSPEKIVDIQRIIGSDIMMALDVCPSGDASKDEHKKAVQLTTKWAKRCINHLKKENFLYGHKQILSPIIQGGIYKDLRLESAEQLLNLNPKMCAIGGLAVGEPKEKMLNIVDYLNKIMPKDKPRYLMGVGTPEDIVESIKLGVDMFDCVIPTRNARNGQLFTYQGKINIRNAKYKDDNSLIDQNNNNIISKNYTKAYLHHLFKTEEILGYRIATQHNLSFYNNFINDIKQNITNDTFDIWSKKFLTSYKNL
ncbi:MAG: tRNA guanosine(34) transglycosylase Tgt [Candidatus Marinimicrobia bacterium]|nr:tRNA guanosine(34) transglycosylase Tgt [Candidatus Neomarinimicrobiota bacterium]|tara:strand:- start:10573 stop:11694 length:1122 start_codon:yes stop_codon:yes gene_type:complete